MKKNREIFNEKGKIPSPSREIEIKFPRKNF